MKSNGKDKPVEIASFSIIKHYNSPNEAVTLDGITVQREEKLFIPEYGRFVMCAPYDNHFIYEDKSGKPNRWLYMCTCGYGAGIVGSKDYEKDASPTDTGELFVCLAHAQNGVHADGST